MLNKKIEMIMKKEEMLKKAKKLETKAKKKLLEIEISLADYNANFDVIDKLDMRLDFLLQSMYDYNLLIEQKSLYYEVCIINKEDNLIF